MWGNGGKKRGGWQGVEWGHFHKVGLMFSRRLPCS